jgi:hypothetical protein
MQQAVSAQMTEHSLVKVHVRMYRVGQHPTNVKPDAPTPPGLVPHGVACNQGQHGYARYAHYYKKTFTRRLPFGLGGGWAGCPPPLFGGRAPAQQPPRLMINRGGRRNRLC